MDTITVQLKKKYFINANFPSNRDCPVARAIKEQTEYKYPCVYVNEVHMEGEVFWINGNYERFDFDRDMWNVNFNKDWPDNYVVREITLTPLPFL